MRFSRGIAALALIALAGGLNAADVPGTVGQGADNKAVSVPQPVVRIAKPGQCVEPTDVMRRDHMKFILHQRDETVHSGIRTSKHSLKNCVECHADPQTKSVLGEEGFCASCHAYTAVSMDCFSCHTHKADQTTAGKRESALSTAIRSGVLVEASEKTP